MDQIAHPAVEVGEAVAIVRPKMGPFGSSRRAAMLGACPCPSQAETISIFLEGKIHRYDL
jgi:hypothetical protein